MQKYNINNYKEGWFIGCFEPSIFKTKDFEVALKVHRKGEHIAKHRHLLAVEMNLCISGEMHVNGCDIKKGDIFVFDKGEACDVNVISDEVQVICVKSPSIPSDKEICE